MRTLNLPDGPWIETSTPGTFRKVTERFAVIAHNPENVYRLSDAIRLFVNERTAQRFAEKHEGAVVRTIAYMRLE